MFFATFWGWLTAQMTNYVAGHTVAMANAIEPAVVTLGTVYVMVWGYLCLSGRIEEPVWEGVKRIFVLVLIFGVAIRLWAYNELVVDTFFSAPMQLAARILGSPNPDPISVVDSIWDKGSKVGGLLWNKGGVLNGDVGFYIAGLIVWLVMGAVSVYTMFLLALSKVALSVVLAIGPLFIALLLFDSTKRLFEAWVAQLANYALIAVITTLVAAMVLQLVATYAAATAARGAALVTVDALDLVLAGALVVLVMRQVPTLAASLASGVAVGSFNAVSGVLRWGFSNGRHTAYDFLRGAFDGARGDPGSRWDSLRRGSGNLAGRGARRLWNGTRQQGGTIRRLSNRVPREQVMRRGS